MSPAEKLKKILELTTENITRKEFTWEFQRIVKLLLDVESRLLKRHNERLKTLEEKQTELAEKLKEDKDKNIAEMKTEVSAMKKDIQKALREQENGMNFIRDKLRDIKDGEDGGTPTKEELIALIEPLIPEREKIDLSEIEKNIKQKIEKNIKQKEEQLETRMQRLEEAIRKAAANQSGRIYAGPNANAVLVHDASSQCNGSEKTFTMPMARNILMVYCTQFPFFYRPTVDYTIGDRSITLTNEVAPPESGQSLFISYVK